ncbi:MAG: hypothetical protein OQK24_10775 [Magnetovibrio sp.]|nr:hypothetical protein [Magnetovibrio sp.]
METFIGGVIGGIVLAGFLASIGQMDMLEIVELMKNAEWETILIGLIAWLQYSLHKQETKKKETAQSLAAAAPYSPQLSSICEYADECLAYTHELYGLLVQKEQLQKREDWPLLTSNLGDYLKESQSLTDGLNEKEGYFLEKEMPLLNPEILEKLTDAAVRYKAADLINLIHTYQVQSSRLRNLSQRYRDFIINDGMHVVVSLNAESAMEDASRLYIVASNLFDDLRGEWQFYSDNASDDDIAQHILMQTGYEKSTKSSKG